MKYIHEHEADADAGEADAGEADAGEADADADEADAEFIRQTMLKFNAE